MKKFAALMPACGSTVVHAQTSVTFYGIADAAVVVEKGGSAGRITKVTSGAGYTITNNTESGSGDTGYKLGMRHSF